MHMQVVETPVAGEVRHYQMLIGGAWVNAQSGRTFESINPYTGKVWAVVPEAAEADVDAAVLAARTPFDEGAGGRMTGTQRARLIRRPAPLLGEDAGRLATGGRTDKRKPPPNTRPRPHLNSAGSSPKRDSLRGSSTSLPAMALAQVDRSCAIQG